MAATTSYVPVPRPVFRVTQGTWDDLAAEYEAAPLAPTGTQRALWAGYADLLVRDAYLVRRTREVLEVPVADPYGSAAEQSADLDDGRFQVSTLHCEHPAWSPAENVAYRIVHDVLGHHAAGFDFSPEGEAAVFGHTVRRHLQRRRQPGLLIVEASEALGQLAWCLAHGGFGPQKCVTGPAHRAVVSTAVRCVSEEVFG